MVQRTGKIRCANLRPFEDEALNALVEETGVNRNRLIRLVATRMTADDVIELQSREPVYRPV